MKRFHSEEPAPLPQPENSFASIIEQVLSRRDCLRIGIGTLAIGFFATEAVSEDSAAPSPTTTLFGFKRVAVSTCDSVEVPEGYQVDVLYPWGAPINGVKPAFHFDATNSADEQELQAGMGHDGMEWFPHPEHPEDPKRCLLCINHEYADQGLLYKDGCEPPMIPERVRKSQAAHGVSVIEIECVAGKWQLVVDSKYARRITATTKMEIHGPAKAALGDTAFGTVNNCSSGRTPWGTYLTCEENFYTVFGTDVPGWAPSPEQNAYGLSKVGFTIKTPNGKKDISAYRWWESDPRFDLSKSPQEPERFGYIVEIDPAKPLSTPIKHTALGRFRHENAAVTSAKDGRVVVYMGDDQGNQFLYKYVSHGKFDPKNPDSRRGLLDEGQLYAAQFKADKSGVWLPLEPTDATEKALVHVCIYTRLVAQKAGATPMDRPEWVAVDPKSGEVFVTLTNNDKRVVADEANPRAPNPNGHIIRWREAGDDAAALTFQWDIFLLAGNPPFDTAKPAANIQGDIFASPDGLKFDPRGILWIQTDISTNKLGLGPEAAFGNNCMLAADPKTGVVRRFLVGPRGCEVTGIALTPDCKTMFVNIQHPGESGEALLDPADPRSVSNWPDFQLEGRPRPATIAIYRKDGREIGS